MSITGGCVGVGLGIQLWFGVERAIHSGCQKKGFVILDINWWLLVAKNVAPCNLKSQHQQARVFCPAPCRRELDAISGYQRILFFSGNDDSYQLSPHCFNGDEFLRESGVRSNRIESTGTGSPSPAISDTERKDNNPSSRGNTPGHEGASRAGCSVTSSSFFAASTAISTLGATTSTVATSATIRPSDKPRIWSLADVATSNTSHGNGRRSNPTAQSLSGPPPLAPIMTSVTCPTSTCGSSGHRSFQPWMHTSSSSSSSPSSGNSPLTAYGNSHWQQDAMNAGHQLDIGAVSCGAAAADIVGTGVRSFGMGSRRSHNSTPEHSLASDSIPLQRLSNGAISGEFIYLPQYDYTISYVTLLFDFRHILQYILPIEYFFKFRSRELYNNYNNEYSFYLFWCSCLFQISTKCQSACLRPCRVQVR